MGIWGHPQLLRWKKTEFGEAEKERNRQEPKVSPLEKESLTSSSIQNFLNSKVVTINNITVFSLPITEYCCHSTNVGHCHGTNCKWPSVTGYLVDREVGSRCQTSTQLWQATARMEAHNGFHAIDATFLCKRCFRIGIVALEKRSRTKIVTEDTELEIFPVRAYNNNNNIKGHG